MGLLKKNMMIELLQGFLGYPPTEQQIAGFLSIVKTGNSEHLCLGDVAIPLKSPAVKYMENMTTALGHYIRDRNEESYSAALKSLQKIKFPVSKIWIDKDILYVKFEREKLMKCILKEVSRNGYNYGKSKLMSFMKITIEKGASGESSAPATSHRGHKLAFHVGEILKHAGAAVELQECDESKPRGEKRQNPPAPISNEQKKDEEEENEISLCFAREPLPTTMISKANQYLFAPVVHMKTNKVWDGSAEDLCKILVEELKRAAMQKHGDIDTPEWSQFLEEQAWRCMSLQMLSVSHCSPLKVEVDGVTQNSRESAFILYNYARLCTIFQSFEESVSEGEIPPLPDIEEVDFALLRNDEEWQLVWGYIFHFPDIIEENAVEILKGSGKFRTVAVTKFLSSFSHRVSEYYSRYHVLCEPLPHLLPTIYARLHLLQAIKTVMEICFATLGVESPTSFM
ncbi:uncharacterized protein LOC134780159 isoform X3 [Penaeus indicus]|uniref:uncharacterized protein LOC134780159 isoform X3 n=1 Tax=Penaeus indicus TaxID=29960 RepID=UPI00300C3AA7